MEALTSNVPAFVYLCQSSSTALSVGKEGHYGLVIWPVVSVLKKIRVSQESSSVYAEYLSIPQPSL